MEVSSQEEPPTERISIRAYRKSFTNKHLNCKPLITVIEGILPGMHKLRYVLHGEINESYSDNPEYQGVTRDDLVLVNGWENPRAIKYEPFDDLNGTIHMSVDLNDISYGKFITLKCRIENMTSFLIEYVEFTVFQRFKLTNASPKVNIYTHKEIVMIQNACMDMYHYIDCGSVNNTDTNVEKIDKKYNILAAVVLTCPNKDILVPRFKGRMGSNPPKSFYTLVDATRKLDGAGTKLNCSVCINDSVVDTELLK